MKKKIARLAHAATKMWNGSWLFDTHDISNTVVLSGLGRGGTTWLGEMLDHDGLFRVMFEPFHPGRTKMVRHFKRRQFLNIDSLDPLNLVEVSFG